MKQQATGSARRSRCEQPARHAHQRQAYSEAAQLLQHSLAIAENLNDAERGIIEREILSELEMARVAMSGHETAREQLSAEIDGFWMGT